MADYRQIATQAAQTYGIPVDTFLSLLGAESSWNPNALSPKGAIGIGQLMPATAKELGVDPYDPEQNIYGSAKYLAQQFKRFGDPALAVAAYNAGPSAVEKYGGVPPYEETQNYVARVMGTQMADQVTPQQMAPQQAAGYQPFSPENLSRSQRTMLGFAALRDAAAALRGNQTSFFGEALGGLQQEHKYGQELAFRRDQEQRLLEENMTNRRNVALQTLGQIQARDREARKIAEITGQPYTPNPADQQLAAMLMSQLEGFGSPMPATPAAPADGGAAPAAGLDAAKAAAPVAMNLPMAQDLIMSGDANEEQLTAAIKFLQRPDVADIAGDAATGLIDRGLARLDKLQTPESTSRVTSANRVIGHMDRIAEMVIDNPSLVGGKGAAVRMFPEWVQANISGDTVELSGLIQTVEADIAFSRLQQMRDESKTGGALGNVSNEELNLLKSALAKLNPNMKADAFLRQLDEVKGHYQKIIDTAFDSTEDRARLVAVLGYDPQAAPVTSGSASGIGWSVAE